MRFIAIILICFTCLFISCGKDQKNKIEDQANLTNSTTQSDNVNEDIPASANTSKISTDWPMLMNDLSYRGISQDKSLRPPLFLAWKFKTGGPVNSSPVIVGDTLYVGSDDHRLYALNADEWGIKWKFETGGKITSAPTVYRGVVYFSSRDLKVYALDAKTGKLKWATDVDGWVNSPVVAHSDKIYVGCYENKIYIIDAETGKKEKLERTRIKIGLVDYACVSGEFYPIDAYTRSVLWKSLVRGGESWPVKANNVVYIGSRDKKLHAFNATNRKPVWSYETDGWIDSSPAISKGKLYIGSRDGYVYAFSSLAEKKPEPANEGVVTDNRKDVYSRPNESPSNKIMQLNEGVVLPILDNISGSWYKIRLPNDQTGWMKSGDFIRIKRIMDLQVNLEFVSDAVNLRIPKEAETASWSPDGSSMSYFANVTDRNVYWMAQSIWTASWNGLEPKWVSDGAFFNPNITWSRKGDWFVFENLDDTERQIWMASSDATGLKKVALGEAPSLSPKGDRIAFVRRGKSSTSVWIRDLDTRKERKIAEVSIKGQQSYIAYGYNANFNPPAWSSDGSMVAFGFDGYHYDDKYARVAVIRASGGIIREFAIRAWRMKNTEFSNDGKTIAYVTEQHSTKEAGDMLDRRVHVSAIGDDSNTVSFEHCESISWSPKGRYLAFVEEKITMGMDRKVWLLDTVKEKRIQLLASRESIEKVIWLDNSKLIVLARASESEETLANILCWMVSIKSLPN